MMFQINEETIIILIIKLYFGIMLILHKTLSQDVNILLKQGKVGGVSTNFENSILYENGLRFIINFLLYQ